MFCTKCLQKITEKDKETIRLIRSEYLKDNIPWIVGYSGGKDSSAVLSLVIQALYGLQEYDRKVTVIYCDTKVENPIVTRHVYQTFANLREECSMLKIKIDFIIVKPKITERFFVKVIGKGYPTPTNIFRWCTKYLRINPVKQFVENTERAIILLGVRKNESIERDRTILKHQLSEFYLKQNNSKKTVIFSPIVNYSVRDVWSTIKFKDFPISIDHETIGQMYKDAGSECPVYREAAGTPCGKGRFGCWTCTVVRKDRSVEKLIANGYLELKPLFEFRNWLAEFRDNKAFRCNVRRNGQIGLGPITLEGRKIILEKLLKLQSDSKLDLIEDEEITLIKKYWDKDQNDKKYIEHT